MQSTKKTRNSIKGERGGKERKGSKEDNRKEREEVGEQRNGEGEKGGYKRMCYVNL